MHRFSGSSALLPPPNHNQSEPSSTLVMLSPPSPQQYTMMSAAEQRSLLEPAHVSGDGLKFFLDVPQQPVRSRMSGIGEKNNRRPIDPPPAVRLRVMSGATELSYSQIETMCLFTTATLTDVHGSLVRIQNREHQMTPLVGVTNTSFHRITFPRSDNEHLQDTIPVFAFTDLSVRQEGVFKLRFNLFEIANGMAIHRAEIFSAQFQVFSAKNFPGMEPSTSFTEILKKHGLRVRVSKSIRTAKSQARVLKLDPVKTDHGSPHHHDVVRHNNYQQYSRRPAIPDRRSSDPPYNTYGNAGLPGTSHLLPPPAHAVPTDTSEPSTPTYGARTYGNDAWNSHDTNGYNDSRGSYHPSEPRHAEPRPQESQHYNQPHQSPGNPYPYPNPTAAPRLPVPYGPTTPFTQSTVPQYPSSNYRTRGGPYRGRANDFPSSRPYSGPSSSSSDSVPRLNHHLQDSVPRDIHYSPIQEGRQAAHNERRNGNEWMGQQFQPPPPPVPLPEQTSFYTSSMAMGFPDQGYR